MKRIEKIVDFLLKEFPYATIQAYETNYLNQSYAYCVIGADSHMVLKEEYGYLYNVDNGRVIPLPKNI